jgi:hypothetical protein
MKICSSCGELKDLGQFGKNARGRLGLNARCKKCKNAQHRAWASRDTNSLKKKLKRHGLTLEAYDEMRRSQNFACKLCGKPEEEEYAQRSQRLSVDHCHETGYVRGLLCDRCNKFLGAVKDSPELLDRMHAYLVRSNVTFIERTAIKAGLIEESAPSNDSTLGT